MLRPPRDLSGGAPSADPARIDLRHHWGDVQVGYVRASWSALPEHTHPSLQIIVPFRPAPGPSALRAAWHSPAGRPHERALDGADVCIFAADQPHTVRWQGDLEQVSFYLTPAYLAHAARDLAPGGTTEIVPPQTSHDPLIRHLGLALRPECRAADGPTRLYAEALAAVLAVHLVRTCAGGGLRAQRPIGGLDPRRLRRVTEYIDAHLARDLSLAALADTVGLSPYHFARAFKAATGLAPHQYVIGRRVERAKDLLHDGDHTVAAVAAAVGFAHQGHLARHFRRRVGVTPGAFRGR